MRIAALFLIKVCGYMPRIREQQAVGPTQAHGEIIYGDTRWIEDDCPDTFYEFIFLFPAAAAPCHDFSLVDSVKT